jgi:hypothetical protein
MFGYVNIDKAELKFREYYKYKGYYCGLCKNLKRNYSEFSRLTLNYDMTFLILVLSSLYEVEDRATSKRCIVHPFKKQINIENEITDYASAINVILSYYKSKDNWVDEKDLKSLVFSKIISKSYKKAAALYEEKVKIIKSSLENIDKLEKAKTSDIEIVSNEFGNLMAEIMVYKKDHWEKILRKVGFHLGKYIYTLDAYLDMEEDQKNNSYNPFLLMNNNENENENENEKESELNNKQECDLEQNFKITTNVDDYAKDVLMLNLSFLSEEIDKLPLIKDKGIIDNIIYSGIMIKLNKTKINEKPLEII